MSRIAFWSWREVGSCMPKPESMPTKRRSPASWRFEDKIHVPAWVKKSTNVRARSCNAQDHREDRLVGISLQERQDPQPLAPRHSDRGMGEAGRRLHHRDLRLDPRL